MVKFLIGFISRLHALLPKWLVMGCGRAFGLLMYALLGSKRREACANLARAFPAWAPANVRRTAREVFANNGQFFVELLRLNGNPRKNPLDEVDADPEDVARFREVMAAGRGALILTAHVNNYIYLAAWAARMFPMTVVAKNLKPPSVNDAVNAIWSKFRITVLPHRGTYRKILQAVKGGGVIGFIMDQNSTYRQGVFVTYFGQPACTTSGLALLSAHAAAPVVPVFLLREGDRFRVRVYPVIDPPPNHTPETLQAYVQRYTGVIEDVVREFPSSWIWMHKRWRTIPKPGDRIALPDGTFRNA